MCHCTKTRRARLDHGICVRARPRRLPAIPEKADIDQQATLSIYKTLIDSADRASSRRLQTNSLFFGINSAIAAAMFASDQAGTAMQDRRFLAAGIAICMVWWWVLRAYKKLLSAKYAEIIEIEAHLPHRPLLHEWQSLGHGILRAVYIPLTMLESLIALVFVLLYIALIMP